MAVPAQRRVDGGQVFRTRSGPNEVIWLVAALDRQAHEVGCHRIEIGHHVARVHVHCSPSHAR